MINTSFPYDWAALTARLTVGTVLFPHGAQKLLGWWGGQGFEHTMNFFTDIVGLPHFLGVIVILIEFVCPLLLLAGIVTRLASVAILIVMLGVIVTVQNEYFFMNWFGTQSGEGMEFFLLMIGLCAGLMLTGGGRFSVVYFTKQ